MSAAGLRKGALLLASLHPRDRGWLLSRLPAEAVSPLRALLEQLQAMPFDAGALGAELLDDAPRVVVPDASIDVQRLAGAVADLPPPWAARVLAAWGGFDARCCLSALGPQATAVEAELARVGELPGPLAEALRDEMRRRLARPVAEAA